MLNLESEKKFIEFLGYSVIGPNKSNRWVILDKEENEVGFIQYKKLHKKSRKNEAIFGYVSNIESELLSYSRTRKVKNDTDRFTFDYNDFEFDYNGNHIDISMGENPSLTIWSKEYGFMNFNIIGEKLFLNFKSKTENYNFEETITVFIDEARYGLYKKKEYTYTVSYCDKNKSLDGKDVNTLEIEFKHNPLYQEENQIKIKERIWNKHKLIEDKKAITVNGTIKEAIEKHQFGIEAFSHFRYLVSEIIPFNEDIIGYILKERGLDEEEFRLFIPDFKKEEKTLTLKKD